MNEFAALFRADYDIDILEHWIHHYLNFDFDGYRVYLHVVPENVSVTRDAMLMLMEHGFEVFTVEGDFNNGELRQTCLNSFRCSLEKDDMLITADSDEFHAIDPQTYKSSLIQYDCIAGTLIDRYDTTLHDAVKNIPLPVQYPIEGQVFDTMMKKHFGVLTQAQRDNLWPPVICNKVMASKAKYSVSLGGSHGVVCNEFEKPVINDVPFPVHHYTWRKSLIERMCGKTYYTAAHIWYVNDYFNNKDIPACLNDKINKEESINMTKGWFPDE